MTKGQNAGNGPIAVDVEKDKSYYWCSMKYGSIKLKGLI